MWRLTLPLFMLLTALVSTRQVTAQDVHKTIIFSVIDANTASPVEGADITFKMLLGKITKKTGSDGKASFDLYLVGVNSANYSYTITTAAKTHKTYTGSLTLLSSKDIYELTTPLQSLNRKVSVSITDATQKQLSHTEVRLRDLATNIEMVGQTDANGVATFDMPATTGSGNFILKINKQGFTELALPLSIDAQTSRVAVVAPLQPATLTADLDVISPSGDMLLPTTNVLPTLPARTGTWGPYKVQCEANVFADVKIFHHYFVEKEKGILESIAASCLEPATKALDSVLAFMAGVEALQAKIQSLQKQAELQKRNPQAASVVNRQQEQDLRLFEQMNNTRRQLKEMLDKMTSFAQGPMAYMRDCLWDVTKDKVLPEEINKLLKAPEYFEKATKTMKEMHKDLATTNYPKLTLLKYGLMDEFSSILTNINKTATSLNVLTSLYENPSQLLPYNLQVSMAIDAAEKGMTTVMTDCQVRECHQQIRKGIMAGKAALTGYNKSIAQNSLCMTETGNAIDEDLRLNKKTGLMGWRFTDDPLITRQLPQYAYSEWVKCHNARIYAQQDSIAMTSQLIKLAGLCAKLQPISAVLNEKVNEYEQLYQSGQDAIDNCQLGEAGLYVNKLLALENSQCGHFFPKPYGLPGSEELKHQIAKLKISGLCDKKVVTLKGEQKYGPFYVTSDQWVPTGVTLEKGDIIRVKADSFFVTKIGTHIGPEGGGVWKWWTLAGEVGSQRFYLKTDGGAEITEGGQLKLGTPRGLGSTKFLPEDIENLQGHLTVYVFVKRKR